MSIPPLAGAALAPIADEADGFDLGDDVDFQSAETVQEMDELFGATEMHYPPASAALKSEIGSRVLSGQPGNDPGDFLRFVAGNTNPHQLGFSWSNLLAALANCLRELSPSPLIHLVLSQNCVHCARAVDQTLQSAFAPPGNALGGPELFQVDRGHMGNFYEICGMDRLQSVTLDTHDQAAYLGALKAIVRSGEYACISVPVASADGKFGHAMNIVNAGPGAAGEADRIFVVCGQSAKVFDLSNADDGAALCARHAGAGSGDASNVYFTPPRGGYASGASAGPVQVSADGNVAPRPPEGALIA